MSYTCCIVQHGYAINDILNGKLSPLEPAERSVMVVQLLLWSNWYLFDYYRPRLFHDRHIINYSSSKQKQIYTNGQELTS
jgi:hypothetical protein